MQCKISEVNERKKKKEITTKYQSTFAMYCSITLIKLDRENSTHSPQILNEFVTSHTCLISHSSIANLSSFL